MVQNKEVFKREELYEKIWKTPIVRLAKDYGISEVALAKICKKLQIPRPSRGYWAKLEFKKKVSRPPLPEISQGEPRECVHYENWKPDFAVDTNSEISRRDEKKRNITVPGSLDNPHWMVKETRAILKKGRPAETGILYSYDRPCLDVRVSPSSLDRALRIMDALIRGFEADGFSVSIETHSKAPCCVSVHGEKLHFLMSEGYHRTAHVPTREEEAEKRARSFWETKKYDYHPTGILSLRINESWAYGKRKTWSDSRKGRLEERVGEFISGAVFIARVLKVERQKREETERRREAERLRREEEERCRAKEKGRLEVLEQQAAAWSRSERIRAFVGAVESGIASIEMSEDQRNRANDWMAWARNHADQIDPVRNILFAEK